LFAGAVLLALAALAVTLPRLESAAQGAFLIAGIVTADLAITFIFMRYFLQRSVFGPLERIAEQAERIAGGAYEERIPGGGGAELDLLARSLNTMAGAFITDREKLAENVASLDRTNQDLVETTEELVRAARMASIGTLAAGLAHEVGNPLGALMGYLDVARNRIRAGGDPGETLESATDEARRIDRIVRSVLDFATPGRESEGPPTVSLVRVTDRALELLKTRGALSGVTVTTRAEPGSHMVNAHPQYLEQVLVNLLMNALWAVRESASPEILIDLRSGPAIRDLPVKRRREDDPPEVDYSHRRRIPLLFSEGTARRAMGGGESARDVILVVSDNGPGIPAASLPFIFDPFYTTKEPGKGTGVGLAITTRIVQELGGKIDAGNRPEGGARFTVRLPEAG
jgi:C4-dicarboxylate-specific signal transduction histidine kinase